MKSMVEYFRINNILLDQVEAIEKHLSSVLDDDAARERLHGLLSEKQRQREQLKKIGSNIRRERTALGITQEKLAELIDVNIRTVRRSNTGTSTYS
jgi:DNA-binding transcriptional regulator YiaG